MKVDIFYLRLHENWINEYKDTDDFDWIQIISGNIKVLCKTFDEETDVWYYLYAYTDNKEYSKLFEELHDPELFVKKTHNMNKEEFEEFERENKLARLILDTVADLYGDDSEEKILCTVNEITMISDDASLLLNTLMAEYSIYDYSVLKSEYIEALDLLQYCIMNRVNGEDYDFYCTQLSYRCTPEGSPYREIRFNLPAVYFKLFGPLLRH